MENVRPNCRFVSISDGPVGFVDALGLQRSAQAARIAGVIPDTLFLLEHSPVVTVGRADRRGRSVVSGFAELSARGIEVVEADRGGDVTYHGPGQLVGYPIFSLAGLGKDLHRYLRTLECVLMDALAEFGISAYVIDGLTGVWVDDRKIAAIGIKVTRWVTMHGFSLNIDLDLQPMRRDIVPCGLVGKNVTSLAELGVAATRGEVEKAVVRAIQNRFCLSGAIECSSVSEEIERLQPLPMGKT